MKTLQLLPYAAAILCVGFAFAATEDKAPVKTEVVAKYVEVTSGTEELEFDWIVNPALIKVATGMVFGERMLCGTACMAL